jgi:hypothetical protein
MQPLRSVLRAIFALLLPWGALEARQTPAPAPASPPQHEFSVRVDPRVELVTLVARFAKFNEFDMPNSRSAYSERIERHFAEQREHPVVGTLRALRAQHGVSFDALPSFAVHLDSIERLELRAPLEPRPERFDARWELAATRQFLTELRDFAKRADAAAFFASEREYFAEAERRFREQMSSSRALSWFDGFFGVKQGARYVATLGLLCGGGNFGVGVRLAGEPEELTPVFGCWTFDDSGTPVFDASYRSLFIHELCHSYTNPFVDAHEAALRAAGERIFASCADKMRSQSYGNARTVLYESLVRASVIRCRTVLEGEAAGAEQARDEAKRHFPWAAELAMLFGEYETDRANWPTFESFMPRVTAFFDEYAAKLPAPDVDAPKLVKSSPANGDRAVDPSLTEVVFEFDRPMRDKSWSIVGAPRDQPEIVGPLRFDSERKRLTVPVKLEAARSYRFALNSERFRSFVSAEGVPLAPVEFAFATAAK